MDNKCSEANAYALYNLFNGVSLDEFCRIVTCKCFKEAYDILSITHEGTLAMKLYKIQMLTAKFKSLRMQEDETISTFYYELKYIVNSNFNLREKILESKVVRKISKSLP